MSSTPTAARRRSPATACAAPRPSSPGAAPSPSPEVLFADRGRRDARRDPRRPTARASRSAWASALPGSRPGHPLRRRADLRPDPRSPAGRRRTKTAPSPASPWAIPTAACSSTPSRPAASGRAWAPRSRPHPFFPARTNVEFVRVRSRSEIEVRFWERGVGETLASGTGSAAAAVASMLKGLVDRAVTVRTAIGSLKVEWPEGGEVLQTGPAEVVFSGDYPTG
ncbi:MAG: hypothetical protein M0C28_48325 [Candidatus Moduliflexus flocculans]|nr:hypothetical protein [Candidatus Moduliflexus flocculans]